jgi:RNA polymerase sigma-70 factor (ECF subfamily)
MNLNNTFEVWQKEQSSDSYEELGKALLKYVRLETKRIFRTRTNRDEQDDIQGEALIRVFQNLSKFDGRSSFATWVTRIILNEGERAIGKIADKKASPLIGNESYDPGVSMQNKILLNQLIEKLPKEDQHMVKLKMEGYEDKEIAQEFNISADAVKKRWERIQTKLRTQCGGGEERYEIGAQEKA